MLRLALCTWPWLAASDKSEGWFQLVASGQFVSKSRGQYSSHCGTTNYARGYPNPLLRMWSESRGN